MINQSLINEVCDLMNNAKMISFNHLGKFIKCGRVFVRIGKERENPVTETKAV